MRKKVILTISLFLLLFMTACKADESEKSSKTNDEKDSVHIQEEKIEQKTNPATVEIVE